MTRVLALMLALLGGSAAAQTGEVTSAPGAILRGLDKVNGATVDVKLNSGDSASVFGLDVALGDCRYPTENPTGDAFAYLTIWEAGKSDQLFDGWMVATSPALSALDHPRYDVWVIRCMTP